MATTILIQVELSLNSLCLISFFFSLLPFTMLILLSLSLFFSCLRFYSFIPSFQIMFASCMSSSSFYWPRDLWEIDPPSPLPPPPSPDSIIYFSFVSNHFLHWSLRIFLPHLYSISSLTLITVAMTSVYDFLKKILVAISPLCFKILRKFPPPSKGSTSLNFVFDFRVNGRNAIFRHTSNSFVDTWEFEWREIQKWFEIENWSVYVDRFSCLEMRFAW